jgi:hypothetical protein
MKKRVLTLMFVLITSGHIGAQQTDIKNESGYFDFSRLSGSKAGESVTEVYLETPLLKMVAKMAENSKEGIAKIIEALKLVRVQEFMVDEDELSGMVKIFESFDNELQGKKWERIIKTKQKGKLANIYVKPEKEGYAGLVIMALDEKGKASFVNIVGSIDLSTIGKLSQQFNLPKVDSK